jgi:hypothetical protein
MRIVKLFEEFIKEQIVKKISPDNQRAENLSLESERKYYLLQKTIETMGIDDNNANDYIEYCYNIVLFLIRAKMLKQGYTSSGQGAHEAEVAFTRNLDFKESEVQFLEQLRYFRNGVLYYGKRFDKEYAEKVIEFTKKNYLRLKN